MKKALYNVIFLPLILFYCLQAIEITQDSSWFLQDDEKLADKKPVLIFDADQVLLDRTYDIPSILMAYMLDATDQIGLLAAVPTIFKIDSDKINIPTEMTKAFNELVEEFNKNVCAFDLDPAVDMLVEKHPILQQKTKSTLSFAQRMKEGCSHAIARKETIDLLVKAYNAGYPIAIGTNQGYKTYKRIMDAKTVPGEDHYVFVYTCDHCNNKRKNPRQDQFPYAKKPSGKYFKGLMNTLNEKNLGDRKLIFIDDNLKNVTKAVEKGFIGVYFTTAQQAENDLKNLGVNL